MQNEIEWISDDALKSHMEKHVKREDEKTHWEIRFLNKHKENLKELIKKEDDKKIIDIYESESKDIHKKGDKIYLFVDKNRNRRINISKDHDNFTVGEFYDINNKWSIRTCFYKKDIFIDTEILTVILQLYEALLKDDFSDSNECHAIINKIYNGVFNRKDKDSEFFCQLKPKICFIYNIQEYHESDTPEYEKALKIRNHQICIEVLKCFLDYQIKYHKKGKDERTKSNDNRKNSKIKIYKYVLDNLAQKKPSNNDYIIRETSEKNLKELIEIYNNFKKYDEFIECLEMSIIFYLICLHISCSNLNNEQYYDTKYKDIETNYFNNIEHKTEGYDIIKKLVLDDIKM